MKKFSLNVIVFLTFCFLVSVIVTRQAETEKKVTESEVLAACQTFHINPPTGNFPVAGSSWTFTGLASDGGTPCIPSDISVTQGGDWFRFGYVERTNNPVEPREIRLHGTFSDNYTASQRTATLQAGPFQVLITQPAGCVRDMKINGQNAFYFQVPRGGIQNGQLTFQISPGCSDQSPPTSLSSWIIINGNTITIQELPLPGVYRQGKIRFHPNIDTTIIQSDDVRPILTPQEKNRYRNIHAAVIGVRG